jgi:DNA-binding NarL/FixJ family response regulator
MQRKAIMTMTNTTTTSAVATETRKRGIFIVDDHPIVRQGLMQLINAEEDLCIVGQAEEAYHALKSIRQLRPDLTILDISLKDTSGLELLKEMRSQDPDLLVLILSMHDESLYAERALRAGARGYVMKQEAPQVLLHAIRKVLGGEVYVSDKMSGLLLQRMVGNRKSAGTLPMDRLTDREMEIFRMIGAGMAVKEIAEKLFLSVKTIEAHREHIKEKLGLKTSAELLRFAIRNARDQQ